MLALSWLEEGGEWVHPARSVIALTPVPTGTRVTLTHDGFARIGKAGWPNTVETYERGAGRHRVLEGLADAVAAGGAKHLMGLRAVRLVSATREGRQGLYRIDADMLAAARAPWLAKHEAYWSAALERLRVLSETPERRRTGTRSRPKRAVDRRAPGRRTGLPPSGKPPAFED